MSGLKAFLTHPAVRRAAQLLAGAIFLFAALPKIANLPAFADSIHNFHMEPVLPLASINVLAMVLPWIELVAGLALIFAVKPRAGAFVYSGLLALFTIAVAVAMARGLSFDCGCFGTATAATIGAKKLAENVGMLFVGLVAGTERR
jgi:putative oxidoreductase